MQINTKYDIGQSLYTLASDAQREICECCGQLKFYKITKWWVAKNTYEISAIFIERYSTAYSVAPHIRAINEADIDRENETYFTTQAAAQAEADRRNAELKGD